MRALGAKTRSSACLPRRSAGQARVEAAERGAHASASLASTARHSQARAKRSLLLPVPRPPPPAGRRPPAALRRRRFTEFVHYRGVPSSLPPSPLCCSILHCLVVQPPRQRRQVLAAQAVGAHAAHAVRHQGCPLVRFHLGAKPGRDGGGAMQRAQHATHNGGVGVCAR